MNAVTQKEVHAALSAKDVCRVKHRLQGEMISLLETGPMGKGVAGRCAAARPGQIRAAAKQMVHGYLASARRGMRVKSSLA